MKFTKAGKLPTKRKRQFTCHQGFSVVKPVLPPLFPHLHPGLYIQQRHPNKKGGVNDS